MMKKSLALLLAAILAFTSIPASAVEQGNGTVSGCEERVTERQNGAAYVSPSLADGHHALWIDRIADLPDYAMNLYTWLEDNSGADGCLADPGKATEASGSYIYCPGTVTSSLSYTYSSGQTPKSAAEAAAVADAGEYFETAMDYMAEVYNAFIRDYPQVFWLNGTSCYGWSMEYEYTYGGGTGTVTYYLQLYFFLRAQGFDIRAQEYRDGDVLEAAIQKRDADADKILQDCPTDAPVQEQIYYLNQVLTQINAYNSNYTAATTSYPWSCVSALAGSVGENGPVCEGYSKAFKVLCDRLGIPCVLVEGDARVHANDQPESHMWNYVQVDGAWYGVDVTWNDPLVCDLEQQAVSGYESEDWLLLGSETLVDEDMTFLQSHPVTNVVSTGGLDFSNGPVLHETAYVSSDNCMNIAPYRTEQYTAPVKEGCIFAGWFADAELTIPIDADTKKGWAYAKFVDEKTLSVKFQLTKETTALTVTTDLRLLSSVDCLQYRKVGFTVELAGSVQTLNCSTVYRRVRSGDLLISDASTLFGDDARYFITYTLLGVPGWLFDQSFTVTPYWQTLDGTEVTGTSRSFKISDSF